jgi:hypothetical protein
MKLEKKKSQLETRMSVSVENNNRREEDETAMKASRRY